MIKDIYRFLHDNYNDREKWSFIHHFVYTLTIGLFVASAALLMVMALSVFIFMVTKFQLWFIPAIAAVVFGLIAVLCWSLLDWINHE